MHTGDWKIDENPVDGEEFDRTVFEQIGEPLPFQHEERLHQSSSCILGADIRPSF